MASNDSESMDFDEDSRECAEILQSNDEEHHTKPDTDSSRELRNDVNENETENLHDTDVEDSNQSRTEDNSRDSAEISELAVPGESATRARTESPIEVDPEEPVQPSQTQRGNTRIDSDENTEKYTLDDGNSNPAEVERVVSKKCKRQTRMDEFISRDSSPDEPKGAKSPRQSSPVQSMAARATRNSSPDKQKAARTPSPEEHKAARAASPDEHKAARPVRLKKRWSDLDTEAYRSGYPDKKDDPKASDNLKFYTNRLKSKPDGDLIDNIHKKWLGNYRLLETHHGYIQWLFPIREQGMNYQAQELQLHEATAIKKNRQTLKRVQKSYELMLDFYGMRLKNQDTGEIERAENWKDRFAHLNRSRHNHLRITRILKSLGELGYERFQYPFVDFVLREALVKQTLGECVESCYNYWIGTVKNDVERKKLEDFFHENVEKHGKKAKKPSCAI